MHLGKYDSRNNIKNKTDTPVKVFTKDSSFSTTSSKKLDRVNKSRPATTRLAIPSIKPKKLHNCLSVELTPIVCKNSKSNLKRKSVSLVELTFNNKISNPQKWRSREHGDEAKINNIIESPGDLSFTTNAKESEIARKVCKMFILHAWRQRRAQVSLLQDKAQKMENEVENLNIQIFVLRNLLESEKLRVSVAMSDSSHLKQLLEKEINISKLMKEELKVFETEKLLWVKSRSHMVLEIKSLNGELDFTNTKLNEVTSENVNIKSELSDCHERLAWLQSKLDVAENSIRDKLNTIQEMRNKETNLESKISRLVSDNQNMHSMNEVREKQINECISKIKKLEGELNNLENIRNVQSENIENLTKVIAASAEDSKKKDQTIHSLSNTINEYETEKEEFEHNLLKIRNRVVFEAIKMSASLLFPRPSLYF